MLEELEIGKEYINSIGGKVKVLCIGKDKVFAINLNSLVELTVEIGFAKKYWEEIPKEKVKHELAYHLYSCGDIYISSLGSKCFGLREKRPDCTRITKDGEVI